MGGITLQHTHLQGTSMSSSLMAESWAHSEPGLRLTKHGCLSSSPSLLGMLGPRLISEIYMFFF